MGGGGFCWFQASSRREKGEGGRGEDENRDGCSSQRGGWVLGEGGEIRVGGWVGVAGVVGESEWGVGGGGRGGARGSGRVIRGWQGGVRRGGGRGVGGGWQEGSQKRGGGWWCVGSKLDGV